MRVTRVGVVVVCLCVLSGLFGYFVWPTPWRDWELHRRHNIYHFATDRFTGQVVEVDIGLFAGPDIPVTEEALRADRQLAPFTAEDVRQMHRRW